MDKQIEEMTKDLQEAWTAWSLSKDLKNPYAFVAEILAKKWQPKIPENAVVLTEDNAEEIGDMVVKSPQMQEAVLHLIKAWQKETAEKFAERLKADVSEDDELHEALNYYLKRDYFEYIDERCKELVDE